jgi:4-amino-4-deoxy-L-arabinose transferase-like glycosyltransferase
MFIARRMMWIFLLLACLGASWFSYQCLLVPQPQRFSPDWHGAEWMQASDADAPVAYFRNVVSINGVPDAAFVTVAANQVFRLYINGAFVASNGSDFLRNSAPLAYMYDVNAFLQAGQNVVAVRVANVDKQIPCVRINLGLVRGSSISYEVSDSNWQATGLSTLVYPRYVANVNAWSTASFVAGWRPAAMVQSPPMSPMLTINPLVYERPIAARWLSAGASHDAYFVCRLSATNTTSAWLRLAATGTASVFINGHLLITWNGQAPVPRQNLAGFLGEARMAQPFRAYLAPGIFDISPYLHGDANTLAVHVSTPGLSTARVGLDDLQAALSLDLLLSDIQGHNSWFTSTTAWHASEHSGDNWTNGSTAALRWPVPLLVARPAVSSTLYLPGSTDAQNTQVFPFLLVCEDLLLTSSGVIVLWLLMALVLRRYHSSFRVACETASIAYMPALAFESVCIALSRETLLPQPFPYTSLWGSILITIVIFCYTLLWLNAHNGRRKDRALSAKLSPLFSQDAYAKLCALRRVRARKHYPYFPPRVGVWIQRHRAIMLLTLIALPLAFYGLAYEPYWQDELASYYAARGILAHGFPVFPSGFLYEKAELYSYLLAVWIAIFGASGARYISAIEYIVSIPLLYFVGCYFFNRRVALLAAAMLALSPASLVWGRQVRMYEQAQVLTLLVLYLFYRAVREQRRVRLLYLATFCLIIDYLSHEEIFIILPALVICLLLLSRDGRHRFPAVLYQKHWWYALIVASTCIVIQLLLTRLTHPPVLGTDSSERPFVQLSTDNVPFYLQLLFSPSALAGGTLPLITLNSVLALVGCVYAVYENNVRARYCALFLGLSFLTLLLVFTMRADRYFYPLLPAYYLVGSYALLRMLDAIWTFARARLGQQIRLRGACAAPDTYLSWHTHWIAKGSGLLICACVLLVPMLPISNYSPFIDRLLGYAYHRHYPDYDAAGQYMQQHWQKGDIVISVAPDFSVYYYTGHVNYFFSLDRALFLFERNGHIVDTSIGATALLNQQDLLSVLATHTRVWIVSDNAQYQAQVAKRFTFPPDFHIVFEGYGSALYLRGG